MGLKSIKRALTRELRAEKNLILFKEAKRRHPELEGHETPMSVLALLSAMSSERWEKKDALIRAVLAEQQERPHQFWNALLVVAFYPMLSRLRNRIIGEILTYDDLDQIVLSSFLEVVRAFPLDQRTDRTCMYLRQMTQRRVFRRLKREQREHEAVCAVKAAKLEQLEEELVDIADPETLAQRRHLRWPETRPPKDEDRGAREQERMIAFLVERVGGEIDDDRLDLVIATQVRGEMLSRHVARLYPDLSPEERRRVYQRIKRRHSRALAKLRELLADATCPQTDPPGALPLRNRPSSEGGDEP